MTGRRRPVEHAGGDTLSVGERAADRRGERPEQVRDQFVVGSIARSNGVVRVPKRNPVVGEKPPRKMIQSGTEAPRQAGRDMRL